MADSNIRGGRELAAFLSSLPAKIEKNIMRSALRAGANVIAKEVKSTAPVGPPSAEGARLYGGYAGALRDSVRVATGSSKDGKAYASVKVGGKSKRGRKADVFYATWVEFGTRPHVIAAPDGKALSVGGAVVRSVEHPGARPQPFVRPAFDAKGAEAIAAVTAQIRKRLTAHGINAPEPEAQ